jgi:hypothetical protein
MESNITDQQYFGSDLQLSEPNFDDETTVLSARRVVPLGDVPGRPSGRRWGFGLAIVFAVMAGALGATVIFRQRDQNQAPAIVNTTSSSDDHVVPEGQPQAGVGGATTDSSVSASGSSNEVSTPELKKDSVIPKTRRTTPLVSAKKSKQAADVFEDQDSDDLDQRELRRAERIEARRRWRAAEREYRREDRGHKNRSRDDLLRIRDIFEGSPRP